MCPHLDGRILYIVLGIAMKFKVVTLGECLSTELADFVRLVVMFS